MSTVEQRSRIRNALKAQGFDRKSYTDDIEGTGSYAELWADEDQNTVVISWAPRTANSDLKPAPVKVGV